MRQSERFTQHSLDARQRTDDGSLGITARKVLAHSNQYIKNQSSHITLVQYWRTTGKQGPLKNGHVLQRFPTIHSLGPATGFAIQITLQESQYSMASANLNKDKSYLKVNFLHLSKAKGSETFPSCIAIVPLFLLLTRLLHVVASFDNITLAN